MWFYISVNGRISQILRYITGLKPDWIRNSRSPRNLYFGTKLRRWFWHNHSTPSWMRLPQRLHPIKQPIILHTCTSYKLRRERESLGVRTVCWPASPANRERTWILSPLWPSWVATSQPQKAAQEGTTTAEGRVLPFLGVSSALTQNSGG